jgi:hypothetical protein
VKKLFINIPFILICFLSFAQGEIDEQGKIFYRNERTFAALLNSTGIGGNFRYAKRITAFKKTLYEVGLASIKHPKEVKISTSAATLAGRSFVYGKLINFYNLRAGIGIQKELFQKFDRGGISIRYFYNFGPTLGIKKPIYYNIYVISADGRIVDQKTEKFDITQHIDPRIMSKASYFKGFDEITFTPGLYAKAGFTFEFSKLDEILHALEAGVILDVFLQEIPIMAIENNKQVFFSLFVSYRFGKIIDSRFKVRKTKVDEMLIQE